MSDRMIFACRLRLVPPPVAVLERRCFAEVDLENVSASAQELQSNEYFLRLFTFVVRDGEGRVVAETRYDDCSAFSERPYTASLEPHESLSTQIQLLLALPEERRFPGRYSAQAIFSYAENRAESNLIDFVVPPPH
jgi:hypothetical protein